MYGAFDRKRLACPYVYQHILAALGDHLICDPAHPTILITLVGSAGMPIGHGVEMGKSWIVVTTAMNQSQFIALPKRLHALQTRVESKLIIQLEK
jgi:hypothetical protein